MVVRWLVAMVVESGVGCCCGSIGSWWWEFSMVVEVGFIVGL